MLETKFTPMIIYDCSLSNGSTEIDHSWPYLCQDTKSKRINRTMAKRALEEGFPIRHKFMHADHYYRKIVSEATGAVYIFSGGDELDMKTFWSAFDGTQYSSCWYTIKIK